MVTPNYDYPRSADTTYSWVKNDGTTGSGSLGTKLIFRQKYFSTSVNTPNFKRLKKSQLPMNPYFQSRHWQTADLKPMVMIDSYASTPLAGSTWNYFIGVYNFKSEPFRFDDVEQVEVEGPCASDLLKRANTTKAQSAVSIAEAHKTAAMVASSATRIYNCIRNLRRLNLHGAALSLGLQVSNRGRKRLDSKERQFFDEFRLPKNYRGTESVRKLWNRHRREVERVRESDLGRFAANSWLELQYGWKPLLSDVYSHAEALAEQMVARGNELRYVSAKRSGKISKTFDQNEGLGETWSMYRQVRIETYCMMGVWYRLKDGVLNPINTFGLNNPLTVAWELVPFSFVVDWFLPIGNALEQLTATSGLVFSRGYKSTRTVRDVKIIIRQVGPYKPDSNFTRVWGGNCTGSWREMYISRSALGDFPPPQLPQFKDPRSFSHAASAISLLKTLFLK